MSLCTYTNAFTQNNTGCSSSVPAEALEDAQHSGLIAASAIINAAPGAPAAPAAAGSTYQNIPVSVLEAAAFKDPDLFKIKVAFMVNEMQALYKEADFVGRQGARTIPMMAWQLASPNGLMAGYAKAMSKTSEAVVAEPDKCVACCDECDEGGCQCTRQDRLLAAWHGNMRQRDDFDDDDDAGAQAGMLTPWRLLYFLCAMGSGKTLPEILMPLLLNWESMMAIRPDEMLAEPCTLLTAPGREQIQQMAMQGLGVTDVGKLSDMPMCYLSGIPAEILVRFNERVVFLDQHTSSQWFHPLNLAKLRKARVFVGGIMKVATLIKYERETLKVPEDERFFHEKKFSLWLADEAHFGIHYPASPFLVPEADGEWAWILHTFKYMFVAKFSGSIHEAEHEGDRVPKGGRCTGGELMYFKRMAEPKITVCSYEGMKKYDGTYFCSHNMTDDDVVKLRTHPRYLNVFFWEVMRDVLRRRRENWREWSGWDTEQDGFKLKTRERLPPSPNFLLS